MSRIKPRVQTYHHPASKCMNNREGSTCDSSPRNHRNLHRGIHSSRQHKGTRFWCSRTAQVSWWRTFTTNSHVRLLKWLSMLSRWSLFTTWESHKVICWMLSLITSPNVLSSSRQSRELTTHIIFWQAIRTILVLKSQTATWICTLIT
jgi:hypothetical protein